MTGFNFFRSLLQGNTVMSVVSVWVGRLNSKGLRKTWLSAQRSSHWSWWPLERDPGCGAEHRARIVDVPHITLELPRQLVRLVVVPSHMAGWTGKWLLLLDVRLRSPGSLCFPCKIWRDWVQASVVLVGHHFNGNKGVSCTCTHMPYIHTCGYINVCACGHIENCPNHFCPKGFAVLALQNTGWAHKEVMYSDQREDFYKVIPADMLSCAYSPV